LSAAIDHCRKDPASAGELTWTPRASLQPDGVNELKKVGGKEFGGPVYSIDCSDFALGQMLAKRRRRLRSMACMSMSGFMQTKSE
jgi:hypothetical protein